MAKEWLLDNVDEFDSTTIYKLFTGLQQVVSGNRITSIKPLRSVPLFQNPADNPRIKALLGIIPDGKVIIWCKFKHEIEDIKTVLSKVYGQEQIAVFYGGLNLKKRIEQIEKFRNSAKFLIANKVCGGYGLNLQFCNNMIYYSNDFNFATRAQSEDRVHRIGQEKDVWIYDICAYSKIDVRILKNLWKKENLTDSFKHHLTLSRDTISDWIDGRDTYDTDRFGT